MSNPYETPQSVDLAPIVEPTDFQPLASPWMRLLSQIIDTVIMILVILPIAMSVGAYASLQKAQISGKTLDSLLIQVGLGLVGLVIYIAINWVFLANGQTIGKKITKLQIRMKNGQPISRNRIITHRLLPVHLVAQIPCIGFIAAIVDALLIFREERNTLHDDIADSKVVQLS